MKLISDIMLEDHAKIDGMFCEFKSDLNVTSESAMEAFNRFKWQLEKHIFAEEKAIFEFFNISTEEYEDIPKVLEEHITLLKMVKEIEARLKEHKETNTQELQDTLVAHVKFEDEVLYPKLEKSLSKDQKKQIAERIKQVLE